MAPTLSLLPPPSLSPCTCITPPPPSFSPERLPVAMTRCTKPSTCRNAVTSVPTRKQSVFLSQRLNIWTELCGKWRMNDTMSKTVPLSGSLTYGRTNPLSDSGWSVHRAVSPPGMEAGTSQPRIPFYQAVVHHDAVLQVRLWGHVTTKGVFKVTVSQPICFPS